MKKKSYTYRLICSFEMPYSFSEDEVIEAGEGGKNDLEPIDDVLINLQNELKLHLLKKWSVEKVDVDADFDDLLGIEEYE